MNRSPTDVILIRRISSIRRTDKFYAPAPAIIKAHIDHADSHGGKVLYTSYTGRHLPENCRVDQVIVWASKDNGPAFIGDVVDNGKGYDPATWQRDDPYQAPAPWNSMPQRFWYALKNVHAISMDPSRYALVGDEIGERLEDLFNGNTPGLACVYVVPKAE